MKNILKKILPLKWYHKLATFKNEYFDGYALKSYSQEGEDMILRRIFEHQKKGFYVDVGAHHPKRFSNTYYFYKQGWSGINIDAMPGSMKAFDRCRPRDINLEIPISDKKQLLTYYAFNESALNGFSKELSESRNGKGNYYIKFTKKIETIPLNQVLNTYLPKNQQIDFLSIDVEGLDFIVLQSNDFSIYKPSVILIEILNNSLVDIQKNEVTMYLKSFNYSIYAKLINTFLFIDNNFYKSRFVHYQN